MVHVDLCMDQDEEVDRGFPAREVPTCRHCLPGTDLHGAGSLLRSRLDRVHRRRGNALRSIFRKGQGRVDGSTPSCLSRLRGNGPSPRMTPRPSVSRSRVHRVCLSPTKIAETGPPREGSSCQSVSPPVSIAISANPVHSIWPHLICPSRVRMTFSSRSPARSLTKRSGAPRSRSP